MTEASFSKDSSVGLSRAVVYSLVFHALLLLLLMAMPASEPAAEALQEDIISVTFEPEANASDPPSELFKVTGDPPEDPTDSTPPPSVLGDPRFLPADGDPRVDQMQQEAPDQETVEPVEGEQKEDRPEESQDDPAEEQKEPEDPVEAGDPKDPGTRDLPEEAAGEARTADEPAERRLDVRSALNRTARSVLEAQRSSAGRPADASGSPEGLELPELDRLPESGFGYGNLVFESSDFDFSDYARQIYMAIWRAWHNRLYFSTDEFDRWAYSRQSWLLDHQLQIRFTIHQNGQVDGIVIEDDSGCLPLDQSAADALKEVILPPLPADFPRDRETVHGRFIGQGDIRALKKSLSWLKSRGEF